MCLLEPKVSQLPFNIQSVYLHNCLKILAFLMCNSKPVSAHETADLLNGEVQHETLEEEPLHGASIGQEQINFNAIQEKLKVFLSSEELEVQERAGTLHNFIKCYLKLQSKNPEDLPDVAGELVAAFTVELNPVASKAQKKVPIPEGMCSYLFIYAQLLHFSCSFTVGLNLDEWINDPPSESEEEEEDLRSTDVFSKSSLPADYGGGIAETKVTYQPSEEELSQVFYFYYFTLWK